MIEHEKLNKEKRSFPKEVSMDTHMHIDTHVHLESHLARLAGQPVRAADDKVHLYFALFIILSPEFLSSGFPFLFSTRLSIPTWIWSLMHPGISHSRGQHLTQKDTSESLHSHLYYISQQDLGKPSANDQIPTEHVKFELFLERA